MYTSDGLRSIGSAGTFAAAPGPLPPELVPDGLGADRPVAVTVTGPLDAAAGVPCAWFCLPLPGRSRGVAFVGAPGRVPAESLVAVRSMMNQFALALRNSDIHGELTTQARTDPLTGLANRARFHSALARAVTAGTAEVAVLFVDLDDFKNVNDVLGHAAGDHVLREVADRLKAVTREGDLGARLGGDEFAVLLGDVSGEGAEAVAERLVEALAAPVPIEGRVVLVGASVGLAYAAPGIGIEELVHHADVAMYAAKANGKNRVQVYEPGLLRGGEQVSFERALAAAAGAGELVVHYQPILSLSDDRCTAVEALVRWRHPVRGLLMPADFIELAEGTGAIAGIGEFVLRRACADVAAWRSAYPDQPPAVHVNVSAAQLRDGRLAGVVARAMTDFAVPAKQLVLEITESMVLDPDVVAGRLEDLAAAGAAIAVDHVGRSHSTLTTLRSLPVDVVKIDRSFVARGPSDPAGQEVVEAIVRLAGRLGARTVAEGVEHADEQDYLRAAGADDVQGYLRLRPVPAEEFLAWLDTHVAGVRRKDRRAGAPDLASAGRTGTGVIDLRARRPG
jgi:diguanylate cyclase (GGDEF)-like protein